jgi:Phage-related protein
MENPKFTAFTRPNGHNEFIEFVNVLPGKDRQKLVATLKKIEEHRLPVASRMEWVKPLNKNIYEIRSKVGTNIQRALYFHVVGNEFIITHGFTKKTQKTPSAEIKHSETLRKEYFDMED